MDTREVPRSRGRNALHRNSQTTSSKDTIVLLLRWSNNTTKLKWNAKRWEHGLDGSSKQISVPCQHTEQNTRAGDPPHSQKGPMKDSKHQEETAHGKSSVKPCTPRNLKIRWKHARRKTNNLTVSIAEPNNFINSNCFIWN